MTLSTQALVVCYAGNAERAPDRVSTTAADGTTRAVVGPSGEGKTTLLRVVAGLLRAQSGQVSLDGVPVDLIALDLPAESLLRFDPATGSAIA